MLKKQFILIIGLITICVANVNAQEPFDVPSVDSNKLLSRHFTSKHVVNIDAAVYHFFPWQIGPIHTHPALCVGYIIKGDVIYQVEGEKPQMLETGKAFYEPSGPRIMRFDNASATGETVFLDMCPEQIGEPFLVFEKDPTEFLDRRALTSYKFEKAHDLSAIDIYENLFQAKASKVLNTDGKIVHTFVVSGEVKVTRKGVKNLLVKAGSNFYIPMSDNSTTITNVSENNPAKVITFILQ